MALSGLFSLNSFRVFISFLDLLSFIMSLVEIEEQFFVLKASELLSESVTPKFMCVSFSQSFRIIDN